MATTALTAPRSSLSLSPTLVSLARAEARRFARHPLFVAGTGFLAILAVATFATQASSGADPMGGMVLIGFFVGVFGFVVAHRLTTSLRRSGDLPETMPVSAQQRTAALCLACLVPAAVGVVWIVGMLVQGALWPPEPIAPATQVAWFADESNLDVLAAILATGPVACLGGPLLGVAVARWAPFRESALVGTVLLVFVAVMPSEASGTWRALSPWAVLVDEQLASGGKIIGSSIVVDVSPPWYLAFTLCLCGLAAVAALLRDPVHRRPLLWTGAVLVVAAIGCYVASVS